MLAALWCLALCASVLLLQSTHAAAAWWSTGLVLVVSCALSFTGWMRSKTGTLQWDGQHWLWSGFGEAPVLQVRLILDFQKCMLLRLRSEDGCVDWLWVEMGASHPHWLAVRRAVVAARRRPRDPDPQLHPLDGE